VTDPEVGTCNVAIWDCITQSLYTMRNNVKDWQAHRQGIIPLGRLAIETFDLRGIA